jgi:protocatechuate 3,4-dioxygenase beta subunit
MRRLLLCIAIARIAAACTCGPEAYLPLCHRIDKLKVLFIGKAVETNDDNDGFIKAGIWYRFTVQESFKGLDPGVKEVIVDPASGTSCQGSFTVGKYYLVSSYGNSLADLNTPAVTVGGFPPAGGAPRPKGPLVISGGCSGTLPIERAAEDIAFVRQYVAAPQPAKVFGFVRMHSDEWLWNDRYPPLRGAEVRITGPAGARISSTGQDGRYEFPDVAPGHYVLTAQATGFRPNRKLYNIVVPAHGCGVANIGMYSDGAIEGAVLHHDGRPAAGVSVEYVHADRKLADLWYRDHKTETDEQGRFRFSGVPPGEFLVGVHIDSAPHAKEGIPPTYWPGVTEISKARVVRLAVNERREHLTIKLGTPAAPRRVKVRVQWPDGRPASSAKVSARVGGQTAEFTETDAAGMVELTLLEGVEYWLDARAWTSFRNVNGNQIPADWVDTEEGRLRAGSGPATVVLVLNKPKPRR